MLDILPSLVSSSLIDTLRDGLVDLVLEQGQNLIRDELKNRIASLRSEAGLRQQIAKAVEAAANRWHEQTADKELVQVVNDSTRFADLPSVQLALWQLAKNPWAPIAKQTLHGKFTEVLPPNFDQERRERGVGNTWKSCAMNCSPFQRCNRFTRSAPNLRLSAIRRSPLICWSDYWLVLNLMNRDSVIISSGWLTRIVISIYAAACAPCTCRNCCWKKCMCL